MASGEVPPEEQMGEVGMEKPILSFTSHSRRLPLIDEVFRSHVENADACGMRVCLALQEDSVPSMTEYQKGLVRTGKIELLTIEKDHGSNTKWTLCRRKYPDATMVVVDDDIVYGTDGIKRLLRRAADNPGALVCRCCRVIPTGAADIPVVFNTDRPWAYAKIVAAGGYGDTTRDLFCRASFVLPAGTAFPEHSHGCVYPPGFPKRFDIPDECRFDDDVLVGAMAARQETPLLFAGDCGDEADRALGLFGLWEDQTGLVPSQTGRTDRAMKAAWPMFRRLSNRVDDVGRTDAWVPFGPAYLLLNSVTKERWPMATAEAARVGLSPEVVLDDHAIEPELGKRTGKGWSRAGLAHLRALERYLSSSDGASCVIMEDDIMFLRSTDLLRAALSMAPAGFGALRMDWGSRFNWVARTREAPPTGCENEIRKGTMWIDFPAGSGDGCTIVSRECAMQWLENLKCLRQGVGYDGSDNALCDACRQVGKPLYVSNPPLCVQAGIGRNFRPRGCALQASSFWYSSCQPGRL